MNAKTDELLANSLPARDGVCLATTSVGTITLYNRHRPSRRVEGCKYLATVFAGCRNALGCSLLAHTKTLARTIYTPLLGSVQKCHLAYWARMLNPQNPPLATTANTRTSSGAAELVGGAIWIKAIVKRLITDRANRNQSGALTHCHTSDSMYRANTRGRAPRIERLSMIDHITQARFYSSIVRLFCQKEQRICQV